MGLFNLRKKTKELTPNMAGYRPGKEWWPDLTNYKKAILLHHISLDDVKALLKEYADIHTDSKKVTCEFSYAPLPDDPAWVYLEFPDLTGVPHYRNFWNYQDLMIWLSQKSDKEFCLAIPRIQSSPLFLSTRDTKNPCGDSSVGIYADRDFYFEVPGEIFEWGPVPTSGFGYANYLKGSFGFDTQWITKIDSCKWEKTQITLSFATE